MQIPSEQRSVTGVTKSAMSAMQGGLSEPGLQSQRIFRSIMEAMARPGKVMPITTDAQPPAPLTSLAAAVLYTLADADTPLWLDRSLEQQVSVADWLTFHISAPIVQDPAFATFALMAEVDGQPFLDVFPEGSQDYPDQSATVILQVSSLKEGEGWELSGPGIKDRNFLTVEPISPFFLDQWKANHALYPRGVDIIFVAPDAIACLPRTTFIAISESAKEEC